MNSLAESKQQIPTTSMTYYQVSLAIAAILVFFTRMDIYVQNIGFGIPLYWLIGFLFLSFPLFISLLQRLDTLSKPVLIWSAGFISLSLISIVIQPVLPQLQYLEDQYRTMIFVFMTLVIFAYHPLVTKWTKLTVLGVTIVNVGMFIYEFLNPLAFYLEQRAPGRSSGFYEDSNTAAIALIMGMLFTLDLIKPKYRLFYALFIFMGVAPTFSRGAIVGWVLVVGLLILRKAIPRYQIPFLLLFFMMALLVLSAQIGNLKYLESDDGTELFQEDTLARVEFFLDPLAQKDDSKASRLHHVEDAWKKFADRPFLGNGLGSGQNVTTISQVGVAQRSHNTYLDIMVEYGFLGAFVFPCLLFACTSKAEGEFKRQSTAFLIFMMAQGFFSHTLMSEFCTLIAYPMMANLGRHSSMVFSPKTKRDRLPSYKNVEA